MSDRAREAVEQAFLEILAARHPGVVWEIERPEGDPAAPPRKVLRPVLPAKAET